MTHAHHDDLGEVAYEHEAVEVTTVGIDIGSATSHVMFSRLRLERRSHALSARFETTGRELLWRSPVILTPYTVIDGTELVDTGHLRAFLDDSYRSAGLDTDDVDSGAVILTGEALKKRNARAISDLFSRSAGKLVVASAGHHLESVLAAHGSGAVDTSAQLAARILNVDIGGGTAKLALIDRGEVVATSAVWCGSRVIVLDGDGSVERVEPPAAWAAEEAGVTLAVGAQLTSQDLRRIADVLAATVVRSLAGDGDVPDWFRLTEPLPPAGMVAAVTFSGGVSEYVYGRVPADDPHDLGPSLADAFGELVAAGALGAPRREPREGIRATVIGASQHTVEMAGNTVSVSDPALLPIRNLPVVHAQLEPGGIPDAERVADIVSGAIGRVDPASIRDGFAISLRWTGVPEYPTVRALAEGVRRAHLDVAPTCPLILLSNGDIGQTLGGILTEELVVPAGVVSLDGLECREWDYVDIGEPTGVAGTIPVVVKSLLFAEA